MWFSIEILVPRLNPVLALDFSASAITVVESAPPASHRQPSSLFQGFFNRTGGVLFHLGDPENIKIRQDRYYVYDALEQKRSPSLFHRFLPRYQRNFHEIVDSLAYVSEPGNIWVSVDVCLGPKPYAYKQPRSLGQFLNKVDATGFRANSICEVVVGPYFDSHPRPSFVVDEA